MPLLQPICPVAVQEDRGGDDGGRAPLSWPGHSELMGRTLRVVGTGLGARVIARAEQATRLDTLEDVLRFGLAQRPAWDVLDVVVQDEYTHDVVLGGPAPGFLVFDTT
jgi:hypothetical protein